jgi:hypothetical protein
MGFATPEKERCFCNQRLEIDFGSEVVEVRNRRGELVFKHTPKGCYRVPTERTPSPYQCPHNIMHEGGLCPDVLAAENADLKHRNAYLEKLMDVCRRLSDPTKIDETMGAIQATMMAMEGRFPAPPVAAILLSLEDDNDDEINCVVCKLKGVEHTIKFRGGGQTTWTGIHDRCAQPYRTRRPS